MKRLFSLLLILALLCGAAHADSLFGFGSLFGQSAASGVLEGPGYDTPEEAVLAYIDAFNAGNMKAMAATFAIETWAERQDPMAFLGRARSYNITMSLQGIPGDSDYWRSLRVSWRYGDLMSRMAQQYAWHPAVRMLQVQSIGAISFKNGQALDEFFDAWTADPANGWQGSIRFEGWLSLEAMTEGKYYMVQNRRTQALQYAATGCDDCVELAAHLTLNGQHGVLFMTCGQYGGRWYNLDLSGTGAIILGLPINLYGLAVADNAEAQPLLAALPLLAQGTAEVSEAEALVRGNAQSPLAGSRWRLTALEGDGSPEILESAEALYTYTGPDAAWGQLRFMRGAFVLEVRRMPARDDAPLGDKGMMNAAAGLWTASGDAAILADRQGEPIPARFEGDTLTITDEALGLTYTFERAASPAPVGATSAPSTARLEGDGYDSPEAAMLAYIDAFNAGDVPAMLSAFAIETWAERTDGRYAAERFGAAFADGLYRLMPTTGGFALNAKAGWRYGTLTNTLVRQALAIGGPESLDESWFSFAHSFSDINALNEFRQNLMSATYARWAGRVAFDAWVSPAALSERLLNASTLIQFGHMAEMYGCDDVTPLAARITVDGRNALLLMELGQYDGRWYILEMGGLLSNLLSMDVNTGGLVPLDALSDLNTVPSQMSANYDATVAAHLESGLTGSRWALVSIAGEGLRGHSPALLDSREALSAYAGGDALYGQLHFTRLGCALRLEQSVAFRNALPLVKNGFTRKLYVWDVASGAMALTDGKQDIPVAAFGDALAFTDPDTDVTYTFQRID